MWFHHIPFHRLLLPFSVLTLLVGCQEQHPACKNVSDELLEWLSVWNKVQMVCIWSGWCNFHPIIFCFVKIQIGLTLFMPAYPGCPGKEAVKQVSNKVSLSTTSFSFCFTRINATAVSIIADMLMYCYTHTTILRPFYRDHPGEPVPEGDFWTLWCKGRLTEADIDHPDGCYFIRTNHVPTSTIPHF